jgi:hypothetical protein
MAKVGSAVRVPRDDWQDVKFVLVEKEVSGGGYSEVGTYEVPFTEEAGSGEVEYIYVFDFNYRYVPVAADIGELTLRFTPLNADDMTPDDSLEPFVYGPVTVVKSSGSVSSQSCSVSCGCGL